MVQTGYNRLTECHMLIFRAQGKWSLWYGVVVPNTEFVHWFPRELRGVYINSTCCYCIIWCVTLAYFLCWVVAQLPVILHHSHIDKIRVGCNLTLQVDMTINININMSCVTATDPGLRHNICGRKTRRIQQAALLEIPWDLPPSSTNPWALPWQGIRVGLLLQRYAVMLAHYKGVK